MIKNIMNLYKKITGEDFIPGDDLDEGKVAARITVDIEDFITGYGKEEYSVLELCYFSFAIRHLEDYTFLDRKSEQVAEIDQLLLNVIEDPSAGNEKDYAFIAYITRPIPYFDGTDREIYDGIKDTPLLSKYMDGVQSGYERYDAVEGIPKSVRAYIDRVLGEAYNVWENYQSDVGGTEYAFQQFLNSEYNFMFFKKGMEAHI